MQERRYEIRARIARSLGLNEVLGIFGGGCCAGGMVHNATAGED